MILISGQLLYHCQNLCMHCPPTGAIPSVFYTQKNKGDNIAELTKLKFHDAEGVTAR